MGVFCVSLFLSHFFPGSVSILSKLYTFQGRLFRRTTSSYYHYHNNEAQPTAVFLKFNLEGPSGQSNSSFAFRFGKISYFIQSFLKKNEDLERHNSSSINPFMLELFFTRPKFSNDVSFLVFASHYKLVYNQSLQTHRTPSVYPSSADTNLSPKSISETISKTRTCIDECTCRVNATTEHRCCFLGFSNDTIGVMR